MMNCAADFLIVITYVPSGLDDGESELARKAAAG
jgi:hypothetical protein